MAKTKKVDGRTKEIARLQSKANRTAAEEQALISLLAKLGTNPQRPQRQSQQPQQRRDNSSGSLGPSQARVRARVDARDPSSYMSTVRLLAHRPMSDSGRACFWSAVHPPSSPANALGLTDASTSSRNTIRVLTTWMLQWDPSYYNGTAPTPAPQEFDAHVTFPPIPEIAALVRIRPSGTELWSYTHIIRRNALDHHNTEDGTFNSLSSEGFSQYRLTGNSSTCYYVGSSITDAGTLTAAAIVPRIQQSDYTMPDPATSNPGVFTDTLKRTYVELPLDSATLTGTNPRAYIGAARAGLFTVSKFTDSLLGYGFQSCIEDRQCRRPGAGGTLPLSLLQHNYIADGHPVTPLAGDFAQYDVYSATKNVGGEIPHFNNSSLHSYISDPCSMTWNVALFERIDVKASFRVKNIVTADAYVPQNTSRGWASHPPPSVDWAALEAIIEAHQEMVDGYPSEANDFLGFLKNLGKGLVRGFHQASGFIGKMLQGIPHPLAQAAGFAVPVASNLLNNLVNPAQPSEIPLD